MMLFLHVARFSKSKRWFSGGRFFSLGGFSSWCVCRHRQRGLEVWGCEGLGVQLHSVLAAWWMCDPSPPHPSLSNSPSLLGWWTSSLLRRWHRNGRPVYLLGGLSTERVSSWQTPAPGYVTATQVALCQPFHRWTPAAAAAAHTGILSKTPSWPQTRTNSFSPADRDYLHYHPVTALPSTDWRESEARGETGGSMYHEYNHCSY